MVMKTTTIYLIRGGDKETGFWFLPNYFNYKLSALNYLKSIRGRNQLKVVKFTSENL